MEQCSKIILEDPDAISLMGSQHVRACTHCPFVNEPSKFLNPSCACFNTAQTDPGAGGHNGGGSDYAEDSNLH